MPHGLGLYLFVSLVWASKSIKLIVETWAVDLGVCLSLPAKYESHNPWNEREAWGKHIVITLLCGGGGRSHKPWNGTGPLETVNPAAVGPLRNKSHHNSKYSKTFILQLSAPLGLLHFNPSLTVGRVVCYSIMENLSHFNKIYFTLPVIWTQLEYSVLTYNLNWQLINIVV